MQFKLSAMLKTWTTRLIAPAQCATFLKTELTRKQKQNASSSSWTEAIFFFASSPALLDTLVPVPTMKSSTLGQYSTLMEDYTRELLVLLTRILVWTLVRGVWIVSNTNPSGGCIVEVSLSKRMSRSSATDTSWDKEVCFISSSTAKSLFFLIKLSTNTM